MAVVVDLPEFGALTYEPELLMVVIVTDKAVKNANEEGDVPSESKDYKLMSVTKDKYDDWLVLYTGPDEDDAFLLLD